MLILLLCFEHFGKHVVELFFVCFTRRPLDAEAAFFVWFRNDVKVNVLHNLVCRLAIVLQDVIIFDTSRFHDSSSHFDQLGRQI